MADSVPFSETCLTTASTDSSLPINEKSRRVSKQTLAKSSRRVAVSRKLPAKKNNHYNSSTRLKCGISSTAHACAAHLLIERSEIHCSKNSQVQKKTFVGPVGHRSDVTSYKSQVKLHGFHGLGVRPKVSSPRLPP